MEQLSTEEFIRVIVDDILQRKEDPWLIFLGYMAPAMREVFRGVVRQLPKDLRLKLVRSMKKTQSIDQLAANA